MAPAAHTTSPCAEEKLATAASNAAGTTAAIPGSGRASRATTPIAHALQRNHAVWKPQPKFSFCQRPYRKIDATAAADQAGRSVRRAADQRDDRDLREHDQAERNELLANGIPTAHAGEAQHDQIREEHPVLVVLRPQIGKRQRAEMHLVNQTRPIPFVPIGHVDGGHRDQRRDRQRQRNDDETSARANAYDTASSSWRAFFRRPIPM